MGKTIAEWMKEQGAVRALRETLAPQIRERFPEAGPEILAKIETTQSANRLRTWIKRFATAATLDDMGIKPGR